MSLISRVEAVLVHQELAVFNSTTLKALFYFKGGGGGCLFVI